MAILSLPQCAHMRQNAVGYERVNIVTNEDQVSKGHSMSHKISFKIYTGLAG